MQLAGRQSKVVVTGLDNMESAPLQNVVASQRLDLLQTPLSPETTQGTGPPTLLYSTASILYRGQLGGRRAIFFHGEGDAEHEIVLRVDDTTARRFKDHEKLRVGEDSRLPKGYILFNILAGMEGIVPLIDSPTELVVYMDSATTQTFWAPVLEDAGRSPNRPFGNYWSLGTNSSIVVVGPYLVRSASYSQDNRQLDLVGDLRTDWPTYLGLFGEPPETRTITWNGMPIEPMVRSERGSTMRTFEVSSHLNRLNPFEPPVLDDWEYADSLPEVARDYDDSDWTIANHTETKLLAKPFFGENVLYGCDYGL